MCDGSLMYWQIYQLDINNDSILTAQYYDGTIYLKTHHLAILFQEIEEIAESEYALAFLVGQAATSNIHTLTDLGYP